MLGSRHHAAPATIDLSDVADVAASSVALAFGSGPASKPRQHRGFPEHLLVTAHQACDLSDLSAAAGLLSILESLLQRPGAKSSTSHRRWVEGMVAAHERLWHLRHPGEMAERALSAEG